MVTPSWVQGSSMPSPAGRLLVHFVEDPKGHGEQVFFSLSGGAGPTRWTRANRGRPVLESRIGTIDARDPFVVRGEDGFVILATELRVSGRRPAPLGRVDADRQPLSPRLALRRPRVLVCVRARRGRAADRGLSVVARGAVVTRGRRVPGVLVLRCFTPRTFLSTAARGTAASSRRGPATSAPSPSRSPYSTAVIPSSAPASTTSAAAAYGS